MLKTVIRYSNYKFVYALIFASLAVLFSTSCNDTQPAEDQATEAEDSKKSSVLARAATGEELYVSYCQICHGANGEEGAMAELLTVPVPDLRYISARRNGNFPEQDLYQIIEGSTNVKGHGSLNMPIWGKTFMDSEGLKSDKEVAERIEMLVQYLKSIQEDMPEETEDSES